MSDVNETRIRRQIAQRLSLRGPQELALGILGDVLTHMDFSAPCDLAALLAEIRKTYPSVEAFECLLWSVFSFSVCFYFVKVNYLHSLSS